LLQGLAQLLPRFVMYAMSFLTLGIFWVGQQTQLNQLARADRDLAWIHIGFLAAAVAIMPFATMLLAEFIEYCTALVIYWGNLAFLGVVLYCAWRYAVRAQLLKQDVSAKVVAAVERRILVAQSLYATRAALCLINTYCSIAFIFIVQLNYAIVPRFRRPPRA
jgi:uncharacterized membrane protein